MINHDEETRCLDLINEKASVQFAERLALCLSSPLLVTLSGEIGAGKTTIVRAMLKRLGVQSLIKSPTFSLVESYDCSTFHIHHFDLYRLDHEDELEYLGFRDYFSKQSICFIEWPEHAGQSLPSIDLRFSLRRKGIGRNIEIRASSPLGKKILACLIGE
jgi:tRNA threonylcarbamoyladenosine biosynthesis protein TsaE